MDSDDQAAMHDERTEALAALDDAISALNAMAERQLDPEFPDRLQETAMRLLNVARKSSAAAMLVMLEIEPRGVVQQTAHALISQMFEQKFGDLLPDPTDTMH
jgi:hypothetical protein